MVTLLARNRKSEAPSPLKESDAVSETTLEDNSSEDKDAVHSLIIPTDGTDLMQGMTVDELKDAEFLPPIVFLDEFMESLNTEPPFEDLSANVGRRTTSKKDVKSQSTDRSSDSAKEALTKNFVKKFSADMATKVSRSHLKHKLLPSTGSKVDYIWWIIIFNLRAWKNNENINIE